MGETSFATLRGLETVMLTLIVNVAVFPSVFPAVTLKDVLYVPTVPRPEIETVPPETDMYEGSPFEEYDTVP
jgi:hypothetical protein